jgi:hypothetical protein
MTDNLIDFKARREAREREAAPPSLSANAARVQHVDHSSWIDKLPGAWIGSAARSTLWRSMSLQHG